MKNKKLIFFLFVTFLFVPFFAQEKEDENISERLTSVEKTVSKLPRITGDINLRHQYNDLTELNSFDVRRVRLDFRGNLSTAWSYRLHFDFASTPTATPKILDVFVNWKINDFVSFQAGQYKIPFSLESPYNPNNLEMADNALAISRLVNYSDISGISANGRDIGISFMGNIVKKEGYSLFNYFFGLFNGSGINRTDDNKAKDLSGIFTINPIKPVSLALSYYNGGRLGGDDNNLKRERIGFGARYDDGKLLIRSEYIKGDTKRPIENTRKIEIEREMECEIDGTNALIKWTEEGSETFIVIDDFKSEGAYAVVGYYVIPKIQLLAKYDYFKGNLSNNNKGQNYYTAGFNFLPANNVRVQFNYTYRTEHNLKDANYFLTQLWVKF
ncbi:MAG: OprO/OprP family phosphate-selective porin [Marinilabiliaceae bacterium]|nr:OprO/OprP family phosphate-selective porin [Marinilabiliaceae bacterium]